MSGRSKALALSLVAATLVIAACRTGPTPRLGEPDYWPTNAWRTASPESQGLDSRALLELLAELSAAIAPSPAGRYELAIGLDGRYRFARGPRGYRVGLRGEWVGENAMALQYVETAGANAFAIHASFEDDRLRVGFTDKTGLLGEHHLTGTQQSR